MTRALLERTVKTMYEHEGNWSEETRLLVIAIQAELAKPEQEHKPEPVAWLARYRDRTGAARFYVSTEKSLTDENDDSGKATPLYEHPPQQERKPCPYCTSDNKAIQETYFDQTCEGCIKRMTA